MKRTVLKISALTVLAFTLLCLSACNKGKSNNSYRIDGTVPSSVKAEWIYLYTVESDVPVLKDSARIEKGEFHMKGIASDTVSMAILHPGNDNEYPTVTWNFILEKGQIKIDSADQFATGTPMNDGLKAWLSEIDNIMTGGGTPADLPGVFDKYWPEHSGNFLGGLMIATMFQYLDFNYADSLARQVPEEVQNTPALKPFFDQIRAMREMQVGHAFTDIDLTTLNGDAVKLSDYLGKGNWVLVDFWASWCGPCRQAMPTLQATVKKFKDLQVIGIAISDKVEETLTAKDNLKITWPILSDPQAVSARTYGISAIPAMVLFAPDGTIAARYFMLDGLEELLTEKMK